jgi:single-strand DNA-binding protein
MVNKIILIGNLGADAEMITPKIAKISVATTDSYKNESGEWVNNVSWHNCTIFNPIEDRIKKLLKGDRIYIEGKVTYTTKNDVKYTNITVKNYKSLAPKTKQGEDPSPF